MISSSAITGALIDGRLFDQSMSNIINDQDLQELNQYFYELYGAKISE